MPDFRKPQELSTAELRARIDEFTYFRDVNRAEWRKAKNAARKYQLRLEIDAWQSDIDSLYIELSARS
jgi:hypothetical protein